MPYLTTTPDVSVAALSERVYQAIAAEHPGGTVEPAELVYDRARNCHHPQATEREMDLMDWGFAYGIAYTLARVEAHAFEPVELAAQRASEAAWAAYQRYGTSIAIDEDRLNEPVAS
jgi:hypothetical protein